MEQNEQKVEGWKDVIISPDLPMTALFQILNILNQRVAQIEDIVKINYEGQTISLTEMIALEAEKEMKRQQELNQKQEQQQEQAEQKAE